MYPTSLPPTAATKKNPTSSNLIYKRSRSALERKEWALSVGGLARVPASPIWGAERHSSRSVVPICGAERHSSAVLPSCPYPGRSTPTTCLAACLVAPLRVLSVGDVDP
ncbi:hypothetical protein LR48_Vigan04g120500 [Vigna angularis]|uniref:Uncharacterized protein n=1 Tax=Phaseolus angularis TaxID=3914 RepID=A0A0L9UEP6_PHAAN|nr:hypothetical protein LR48_Vigan04g120500 [Vigna angularis]